MICMVRYGMKREHTVSQSVSQNNKFNHIKSAVYALYIHVNKT